MLSLSNPQASIALNWLRYNIAFTRAFKREQAELLDSLLILIKTSLVASASSGLSLKEFIGSLEHSGELLLRGITASNEKLTNYSFSQIQSMVNSSINSISGVEGEKFADWIRKEADVMESVASFHEEIEKVKDEFGFHFECKHYRLVDETPAFRMYQVLPIDENVEVNDYLKPVLLVPPYMLGPHILSFLPFHNKSYAHAFANEGIPTYIRVVKDIKTTEAVQTLTPEDDCKQTIDLVAKLFSKHGGKKVVLNGTCQGGYICLMNLLTGRFKHLCDALITNVTPIDGTLSKAISGSPNLSHDFMTTTLPNGNKVANGYLLSLGMRFVAIDRETPLVKVLDQANVQRTSQLNPGKTMAALFRWLLKERVNLPLEIAKMSSCTFRTPVSEDGTLPIQLYGQDLNVKDLVKFGVKWHQNYAIKDDLVTPPCATSINDLLPETTLESVAFPGGHVAILTSPYNKTMPVNGQFIDAVGKLSKGPVKWYMDLCDAEGLCSFVRLKPSGFRRLDTDGQML